jgi:hypothetical protein
MGCLLKHKASSSNAENGVTLVIGKFGPTVSKPSAFAKL